MAVTGIASQLRTTDLDRAVDFYTTKLGFDLAFRYEDFYAGVASGGCMVHLKRVDVPDPGIPFVRDGDHLHLYLTVDDVESAFEKMKRVGVTIVEELRPRPWGTTEFVVEDPDGHVIYYAQPR